MVTLGKQLAHGLQEIFSSLCQAAAHACAFGQRCRKLTPAALLRTLVFGWLERPHARLEDFGLDLGVSPQAVDQRLTRTAADFLLRVLTDALHCLYEQVTATRRTVLPLCQRFVAVEVEDCTSVPLPKSLAAAFPGCGGSGRAATGAALKLHTRYEVLRGAVRQITVHPGRTADPTAAAAAPLPVAGTLRLRDLAFFDRQQLDRETAAGVFWITRPPTGLTVQVGAGPAEPLAEWLRRQDATAVQLDLAVQVGQADGRALPLGCRLIALRCPPEVAARRRQKVQATARRKGRAVSPRQLVLCDWTVLLTNVPETQLTPRAVWEVYRVRWQVELLFKRWKSLGGLCPRAVRRAGRALCEVYAKLLGMLVAHWTALVRGGPLGVVSMHRLVKAIQRLAPRLAEAVGDAGTLQQVLAEIERRLRRVRRRSRAKTRVHTRQRMFNKRVTA
jgi:hypothetical protein